MVGSIAIWTGQSAHSGPLSGREGAPRAETAQSGKPSPQPFEAYREKPSWWTSTIT